MAAIFVLTRHTGVYWNFSFYRSYLAVDLFFILSGFVIAYAYDEKIRSGIITFRKFVLIRLIRLYPVFLLSLLIALALLIGPLIDRQNNLATISEILKLAAITALFLPSHMAGSNSLFPLNGPYWSLFFELIANFVYAALRPILNSHALVSVVLVFGLIVAGISRQHGGLDIGFSWGNQSLIAGFSRSIFGIFLGLFLYRHQSKLGKYLGKPYVAWLAVLAIAAILASPSAGKFNWEIDTISVIFIFPITVLCASQGTSPKLQGLLVMLGSASYPIYVLHAPVSEILASPFNGIVKTFAPVSGVVLVFVLIALSVSVERYYDIPLRRRISGYFFGKSVNQS